MVTSPLTPHDLILTLRELRLPDSEYVVGAQGAMLLRGHQPRDYIDLLVTAPLYAKLREQGWTETEGGGALAHGSLRAHTDDDHHTYRRENARLMQNAHLVEGVPFVRITDVRGTARPAIPRKKAAIPQPFPNAFAFLRAVVVDGRSAFIRARNQTFWGVAFTLAATVESIALFREFGVGAVPLAAVIAGISLVLVLIQTSMARSLRVDDEVATGSLASQLALIGAALAIPLGVMVLVGAPPLLLFVALLIWMAVHMGVQVVLFSTVFEISTKAAANAAYVVPVGVSLMLLPGLAVVLAML